MKTPIKLTAELIGTFLLTVSVYASSRLVTDGIPILIIGLSLCVIVYLFADISGAHVNPAITVGQLVIKKINFREALLYLIAQFLGAIVALLLIIFYGEFNFRISFAFNLRLFTGEFLGTLVLGLGIGMVTSGQKNKSLSGLIIGLSLMLGILIASPSGGGILNPAIALSIGEFGLSTLVGPILGGISGSALAKLFSSKMEVNQEIPKSVLSQKTVFKTN